MNKNTGLIYKQEVLRTGYLSVRIGLNHSDRMHIVIHKAVAHTFINNPDNLPCVNHIDGNKKNNSIDNLEWCTYEENIRHAYENKLISIEAISGELNSQSKLSVSDIQNIRKEYAEKTKGVSERSLATKYGVSKATIRAIIKRETWKYVPDCA
jgi:DNA-binding transcriptional regulator YiaG